MENNNHSLVKEKSQLSTKLDFQIISYNFGHDELGP